jgi:hypothetical protein
MLLSSGSYSGSDVGGMYSSSYGGDLPRRDVSGFTLSPFLYLFWKVKLCNILVLDLQGGGSSYSSIYSSRGLGGSSYSGGGPGSYY